MNKTAKFLLPFIDLFLALPAAVAALFLRVVRRVGVYRLPLCRKMFRKVGIFPIRDHYYEPLFNVNHLRCSLRDDRKLPGIDWNVAEQIELLQRFDYEDELLKFPLEKAGELEYYYNNDAFASGDAEIFYSVIRYFKPKRIVEIGSGYSTLLARSALLQNEKLDESYKCEHTCIEPYEMAWLEKTGAKVMRQKLEEVDRQFFLQLDRNDILFIDSSHMIRPQGDVVVEFLEILPTIRSGVLVHVHDIFSPKDYLDQWIEDDVRFWNEQYLLEAFLSFNYEFKIIGALNFLKYHHGRLLASKCPVFRKQFDYREPGSFWMQKK